MQCRIEGRNVDYKEVPLDYMVGGTKRYLEDGIRPGGFLYALFCNDLFACWNDADDNNREHIGDWLRFLHYEVPGESHGSVAEVEQWIKDGGYTGRYNKGKSPNEVVR